jgi:hypothetical protein
MNGIAIRNVIHATNKPIHAIIALNKKPEKFDTTAAVASSLVVTSKCVTGLRLTMTLKIPVSGVG